MRQRERNRAHDEAASWLLVVLLVLGLALVVWSVAHGEDRTVPRRVVPQVIYTEPTPGETQEEMLRRLLKDLCNAEGGYVTTLGAGEMVCVFLRDDR